METMEIDTTLPPKSRALKSIRQLLERNILAEGDPLPSEQELADQIKVARKTVRAALQDLQDSQLIRLQGRRRYVTKRQAAPESLLASTLVVLSDGILPPTGRSFSQGHQPAIFNSLTQTALQRKYSTLTLQAGERWVDDRLRQMLAGRPCGLIVLNQQLRDAAEEERLASAIKASGVAAAGYVPAVSRLHDHIDTVGSDHRAGCYRLTNWLLARGRKRILRFWALRQRQIEHRPFWLDERDAGYEQAMREAGGEVLPAIHMQSPFATDVNELKLSFEQSKYQYTGLLYEWFQAWGRPDAILLATDGIAPSVGLACRTLGLEPNRDIWLAGYDNYVRDVVEARWEPTLPMVTADKHNARIGELLTQTLLRRLDGELPEERRHIRVEPEVVELMDA